MKKTVLLALCCLGAALVALVGPVSTSHAACPANVTDPAYCVPSAPEAITVGGANFGGAGFVGRVTANGLLTQVAFQYGPTPSLGRQLGVSSNPTDPGWCCPADYVPRSLFAIPPIADSNETYFRVVATNSLGTTYGEIKQFGGRVQPPAPTVFPTKLEVARAQVQRADRQLSVLAPITARAAGRLLGRFQAAGRTLTFPVTIDAAQRRVRFSQKISAAQARLGTGILTLAYGGDADTQPQTVRLRAASGKANLNAQRPRITGGRLQASGTISDRARGVVRLQLLFEPPTGPTRTLSYTARIEDGRFRFNQALPADVQQQIAARRGTVHSYALFTGYLQARMRGEMQSYQVLPSR